MYALDLIRAIFANLSFADGLMYVAAFCILTFLAGALGLLVIHGRFRVRNSWIAVCNFSSLSATVGGLLVLTFLPWPAHHLSELEKQIIQTRAARFELSLCSALNRAAERGEYSFIYYENGQGIVEVEKAHGQYFPLVRELANTVLPNANLKEPQCLLQCDGLMCQKSLVHRIVEWNRSELEEALLEALHRDSNLFRSASGICAFIFLLLLLWLSDRYGRHQAESCFLNDEV